MAQVIFILNNPAVPENIGFSIRALKTMGFDKMRIVNGVDHNSVQTRKTAYGSHDVLKKVETFSSLKEALADVDLVVGTTAKKRSMRDHPIDVKELSGFLQKKGTSIQNLAIVFGSEESGLSKEDLILCDVVSTVPLATTYPSLNLSQSVLLYAWELSGLSKEKKKKPKGVENETNKTFTRELEQLLEHLQTGRSPAFHQKVRDRAQFLNESDMKLALSLMGKLRRALKIN